MGTLTLRLPDKDRVDLEFFLSDAFTRAMLDRLQRTLVVTAPVWSSRTFVSPDEGAQRIPIDISGDGALENAMRVERERIGALGLGASATLWFEGASDEFDLQVEMSHDKWKRGGAALANSVSLLVNRSVVEGVDASVWMRGFACTLAAELPIEYGFGRTFGEFASTNKTPPNLKGVPSGLDFRKHLPGLYWLNCFGKPQVARLGLEQLLSAPAHSVEVCSESVLLSMGDAPWGWEREEYAGKRNACIRHIGRQFFFDRSITQDSPPVFGRVQQ